MSTELAGRASSILTSSDLTYYEARREAFSALPPQVQAQARLAYQLFRRDPSHPSIRFKQVHPAYLLGPCRYRLSRTSGEGRG